MHPWREHSHLRGRFLADYPDDLQVLVHDGGPRLTTNKPEAVWVTVTGVEGAIFRGKILNQPQQLETVRQGSEILFLMPEGGELPLMVTAKYLRERDKWIVHPCRQCGLAELFDAPTDLMRVLFPQVGEDGSMQMFTTFCPLCGGVQGVESLDAAVASATELAGQAPRRESKPWWKFW